MKIDHIAMYVTDLEKCKEFYSNYFEGIVSEKYYNPVRNFSSFFVSFKDGCRLELMHLPSQNQKPTNNHMGLNHLAFSLGSIEKVNKLTEQFRKDGYPVQGEPRITGDGYYESIILDPDGNRVELTV